MIDVSVIICAYTEERWADLLSSVSSIQQQSKAPREIIVVIDHNKQLLERAQANISDAIVIENYEPKGLSGARNSGIAISQGMFIAFLDDDAIAEPDWLEKLHHCCQYPHVLGVGGVVIPLWSGKQPLWFPKEFYWVLGCSYQNATDTPTQVRNPYGGCLCIRREVFDEIGGFRSGIGRVGNQPMGGEETELCIRATQHWPHRVFLCEPHARIHHRVSPHRTSLVYFLRRCYAEGLSKAIVTRCVGAKDSLSSEKMYAFEIVPLGILHGIQDTFANLDIMGILRAAIIIVGLLITLIGYLVGTISKSAIPGKGDMFQVGNKSNDCKEVYQ